MVRLTGPFRSPLLLACYLVCGAPSAQPTGVTISYSLVTPVVVLQEPVLLEFEIDNSSATSIKVDLGKYRKLSFSFDVTFPNGTTILDLALPLREGIGAGGRITVAAGERYVQRLLLNEWVNFSEPGLYQVEAKLMTAVEADGGITVPSQSFRAIVNVLPRDEVVLARVCERLVDRIEKSASVEEAMDAAAALSYVIDPVAVPYLSAALRSEKYVVQEATAGLERIGDMSATQALISVLRDVGDREVDASTRLGTKVALVRNALRSIERRTTDTAVKKVIQEALTTFPAVTFTP